MGEIIICPHCGETILITEVPTANDAGNSPPVLVRKG